jgi:transcriptional regulator with XRE-family HTH domain
VLSGQTSNSAPGSDLGGRVRSLRQQRGLTLKALGARAGLSHPFLSQVERGLARPSVVSVERIADALDVPVAHLWAPARPREERLLRRTDSTGMRELLAAAPAVHEWSSGSRRWPAEADGHAGDVLVYVARGALDVDLDGTVHELEEGDALVFDGTTTPYRLRRRGSPSTRALILRA